MSSKLKEEKGTTVPVRVPMYVREWLEERASENCRTLSGEVLFHLKQIMRNEVSKPTKNRDALTRVSQE